MSTHLINTGDPNALYNIAGIVGDILESQHPRVCPDPESNCGLIPHQSTDAIAEELTLFIANVIQSWLDAGSERDVTLEELGPAIRDHIHGWTDHPDNAPQAS